MLRVCVSRTQLLAIRPIRTIAVLSTTRCSPLSEHHVMPASAPAQLTSPFPRSLIISRVRFSTNGKDSSGDDKAVESTKWNLANVRRVLREYGTVAVVFHTVMSLASLGTCYTIVNMGVNVEGFIGYFKVEIPMGKEASTFAIAYLLHKLFLPLRAAVTITAVPMLVRWLRAKGIMKMPIKQTQSH